MSLPSLSLDKILLHKALRFPQVKSVHISSGTQSQLNLITLGNFLILLVVKLKQ